MSDALWPPDEIISGRRTERPVSAGPAQSANNADGTEVLHVQEPTTGPPTNAGAVAGPPDATGPDLPGDPPVDGAEHVGSPWSQPPGRPGLVWSGPPAAQQPHGDVGPPGPWLESPPAYGDQHGGGIQHGQPVPHVPVSGAPVRSPASGTAAAVPLSGSTAVPVAGAAAVPVPGGPDRDGTSLPGAAAPPTNGVPVPRPPVMHPPQPAPPTLPPPPAPPHAAPNTYGPPSAYPPYSAQPAPPTHAAPPAHPTPPAYPGPAPTTGYFPPPVQPAQPAYPTYPGAPGPPVPGVPPAETLPELTWSDGSTPTAEEFARRRQNRPADPSAARGVRGAVSKGTFGMLSFGPGRREQEYRLDVDLVRRNFGGLRQVTVVNPKGGAGKTVAVLLLAMTFGQKRGGYVLAWDNNETQGTLGMRAQQDFHSRTVRDLLRDLNHFKGAQGRVGDLSQYVRAQGEGMFDVLASDESATAGEMLTALSFGEIRDVVSRFYKLIVVDTGNNVRAENWQAAIDATDQLVVTMSARNDSAETASRMLDHLEQHGRQRLVRQAVTVVSMPPSRRHLDVPAITQHFAARTRTVLLAPYERVIDSGEPIRYAGLSSASRDAWLKVAAAISEGL
ncbi:chromosome partitioning protein [Dactylosporangium siamense]|uniref:Chromosome partitioning protein n=1 Tax=Dactylosporangium siamense TaxID=685454 RepID=A0A919UDD2_9ACTN|nr:chromosome partitioning protein [Dactylosporangium siamense]GIG46498.1 chromosome partitioning protein [Dactylosporangium siamense]